jgi:ribose transport system substrate-binding protein
MKSLRILALLASALAVFFLPSCSGGSGKAKVAFVTNNSDPFWGIAEAGAKKSAAEESVELVFRKPDPGDAATQKEVIDTVVNQGVKALAVSVIDPKNQAPYIDEVAAKVPLLTQDNDAPNTKRLCYVGTDNIEAGKAVGRLVKEAMPDGGVIAIFVGDLAALNAQQRRQGVLDELAGTANAKGESVEMDGKKYEVYGKYKLYHAPAYTDMPEKDTKAKENAVDAITALQREKDIALIGLWAYNPPAILSAVEDKAKDRLGQIKIIAFDENPRTLEGIAKGHIVGTVVQNPYEFGFQSVKLMAALAKGDKSKLPASGLMPVDFRIITKDGGKEYPETVHGVKTSIPVEKFRDELDHLLGKK